MRRLRLLLLLPFALLSLAVVCVDQQQTAWRAVAYCVGAPCGDQRFAQTITAGMTGALVKVRVAVGCQGGAGVLIEIQKAGTGFPDGNTLTSRVVFPAAPPPQPPIPLFDVDLPNPVPLQRGERFAIVMSSFLGEGACFVMNGPLGETYTGGNGYFMNVDTEGFWICLCSGSPKGWDLVFETYMDTSFGALADQVSPGSSTASSTPDYCGLPQVRSCEPAGPRWP